MFNHLFNKNYGMAGAISVVLFIFSAILCLIVYFNLNPRDERKPKKHRIEESINKDDRLKPKSGVTIVTVGKEEA